VAICNPVNPVKVGMVDAPWDYRWSSVHAHLSDSEAGPEYPIDSAATSGLFLNILSQKRLAYAAAIPFAATVLRT